MNVTATPPATKNELLEVSSLRRFFLQHGTGRNCVFSVKVVSTAIWNVGGLRYTNTCMFLIAIVSGFTSLYAALVWETGLQISFNRLSTIFKFIWRHRFHIETFLLFQIYWLGCFWEGMLFYFQFICVGLLSLILLPMSKRRPVSWSTDQDQLWMENMSCFNCLKFKDTSRNYSNVTSCAERKVTLPHGMKERACDPSINENAESKIVRKSTW